MIPLERERAAADLLRLGADLGPGLAADVLAIGARYLRGEYSDEEVAAREAAARERETREVEQDLDDFAAAQRATGRAQPWSR